MPDSTPIPQPNVSPGQLRAVLNIIALICASSATALAANGHPLIALAFVSIGTFVTGWANLPRPGDVKVPKGGTVSVIPGPSTIANTDAVVVLPPAPPPVPRGPA